MTVVNGTDMSVVDAAAHAVVACIQKTCSPNYIDSKPSKNISVSSIIANSHALLGTYALP